MGLVLGFFISVFMLIFTAIVKIGSFLVRRFDITNSILISGIVQLLTINCQIGSGVRWLMFIGIGTVCYVLQHKIKVFRFIFAGVSIFAACVLAYSWVDYETIRDRNIAMIVATSVVAALNLLSWAGIRAQEQGAKVSVE